MHLNQRYPQSGYDLHFESQPEGKSGIGPKGIDLYVERRLRVEDLGRAYLSGETKPGARDDLVAALVPFDEVRAGELWDKEMSAGLADHYTKALSSARLSASFWLQSGVRVTAGTPIDVLFGMRTKIFASMDEVGLDFWEQWRGSPSAVAVRTVPEWR